MAIRRNGRLAGRQTVLRQQFRNGAIRSTFLPQFNDDFLRRDQILELLGAARREFGDRLADFGWVKRAHRKEWSR